MNRRLLPLLLLLKPQLLNLAELYRPRIHVKYDTGNAS